MSRSWERMVRKNTSTVNKQHRKRGTAPFTPAESKLDKFRGRNYILPIAIILFIGLYVYLGTYTAGATDESVSNLYWVTIGCYAVLAALFFLRRPYLTVGKDYVQTRKMTGDKRLAAEGIKSIIIHPGHIIIEQVKGANWIFSKVLNRFPTEQMAERLRLFAKEHHITLQEKS